MGNKKKVGTRWSCFRKRKNVGKPAMKEETPESTLPLHADKVSSSKLKLGKNADFLIQKMNN